MSSDFFPEVRTEIQFEGSSSDNPLAFKHYNPDALVFGKTMKEHLRFSIAYWQTSHGCQSEPFGCGSFGNSAFGTATARRPWELLDGSLRDAKKRVSAAFEFYQKLRVPYYTFHDRDIAPEGRSLKESNKNLDKIVYYLKEQQKSTGIKLLWGAADLSNNPLYLHGSATSPHFDSFAYAAAQVKKCLEITKELDGENYFFMGDRDGYQTILNSNIQQELDQLATFFQMALSYAKKIGFDGQFLIATKPKRAIKNQYNSDVASCSNFLRSYKLENDFKLGIHTNQTCSAVQEIWHELESAGNQNLLGSIIANRSEDISTTNTNTCNIYLSTQIMLTLLKYGGLNSGGINFDSKVKRESFKPIDLFYGQIGSMDAFARGLKTAVRIIEDDKLKKILARRYASWETPFAMEVRSSQSDLESLESYVLNKKDADHLESGHQELLENIFNQYI
jgi:xylose isomerase